MKTDTTHLRLVGSCPDQVGIIARVAGFIADQGGNITASNQYEDVRIKTFFMRYGIELLDTGILADLRAATDPAEHIRVNLCRTELRFSW